MRVFWGLAFLGCFSGAKSGAIFVSLCGRTTYVFHELQHHAVPLARERVLGAVLAVGHEVQNVIEADLARHPFQQVDAKAVEPGVASVVLFIMHHHIGVFLAPPPQLFTFSKHQKSLKKIIKLIVTTSLIKGCDSLTLL
jgi:hypothetical protein